MIMEKYIHEIIFGTLLSNILLLGAIIKFCWKLYAGYSLQVRQHHILWREYVKKHRLSESQGDF
jgi:hypothetical protein